MSEMISLWFVAADSRLQPGDRPTCGDCWQLAGSFQLRQPERLSRSPAGVWKQRPEVITTTPATTTTGCYTLGWIQYPNNIFPLSFLKSFWYFLWSLSCKNKVLRIMWEVTGAATQTGLQLVPKRTMLWLLSQCTSSLGQWWKDSLKSLFSFRCAPANKGSSRPLSWHSDRQGWTWLSPKH